MQWLFAQVVANERAHQLFALLLREGVGVIALRHVQQRFAAQLYTALIRICPHCAVVGHKAVVGVGVYFRAVVGLMGKL